jgi:hypothetical protein
MTKKPQVYVLRDPRDMKARYVGQSVDPAGRLRVHGWSTGKNPAMTAWLQELHAAGMSPIVELPESGSEGDWIERLSPDLNQSSARRGRGGGRAGAGRPSSTGGGYVNAVTFRISNADFESAKQVADRRGISVGLLAKLAVMQALNELDSKPDDKHGGY